VTTMINMNNMGGINN